ncbi:hypothetical protein [Halostella litorea]|uniref:hypothetical protein n=1 Tax=Halostella litorea TaxID=2528831 RepID=UPI0010918FBB|nr:hypothetical protein [Halostella litorea]
MARTQTVGAVADDLFDRYLLPKVALTIILVASLVGVGVSVRLSGRWRPLLVVAKWAQFVALGVLAGGLLWKHGFVRPRDVEADAGEYCERMYGRFDRIAVGAAAVLAAGSAVSLPAYAERLADPVLAGLGVALAATAALVVADAARERPAAASFRSPLGLAALAAALAAVGATATAEVALTAGPPAAVAVRSLHLLAFAAWIGGAVWNIFIAVPTGQANPTTAVVGAAGQQLERFRWVVRFVFPTILLTGLYQAVDALGASLGTYLGSPVGLAVLAKVGAVGTLFVVFKLCPMWRACSPIEGVCDIADGPAGEGDG